MFQYGFCKTVIKPATRKFKVEIAYHTHVILAAKLQCKASACAGSD